MPRSKPPGDRPTRRTGRKPIEHYEHLREKRANNPPVGLVRPENDPDGRSD